MAGRSWGRLPLLPPCGHPTLPPVGFVHSCGVHGSTSSARASCEDGNPSHRCGAVTQLSKRQFRDLQRVWDELRDEPDAAERPSTDDAMCRDWLEAWLAGVISSHGRLTSAALDDLLDLAREAKEHRRARAYVDRVVAAAVPLLGAEPPWFADL